MLVRVSARFELGAREGSSYRELIALLAPVGVLAVYMTGRSDVFFGLKTCTLGIILGQEIGHVLFKVLKSV